MSNLHHFHIPVLGTGFTIDTPLAVAPFGISSVVSLVDDQLIEQMYKYHSNRAGLSYIEIKRSEHDARARRITRYLNLLQSLINSRFCEIRNQEFSPQSDLTKYFELLPNDCPLRLQYRAMLFESNPITKGELQESLRQQMELGSIDVNIMTKLDRAQYKSGVLVEAELSDALAALKGFAESSLSSAIVFSAGVNVKLFQAVSEYNEFLPRKDGLPYKRVILKVSDYRSAITQGKLLAKKGIWVSEFRIESGLNCGGHAFPTKGELLGVTLKEFMQSREVLSDTLYKLYSQAISQRLGFTPDLPKIRFSAQGGVGSHSEHELLRGYFHLDSVGWGTPFLLVPEVTRVDQETRTELVKATAGDVVLSDASPLGVPFYILKNSSSEKARVQRIIEGKPGSPCYNKYLASNTEFGGEPLCVASRVYQKKKLAQLEASSIPADEIKLQRESLLRKACICFDLGAAARMDGNNEVKDEALHPAICPGPNIAHFNSQYSLEEMVDHIYGRPSRVHLDPARPHFLIKEAMLYADYIAARRRGQGCADLTVAYQQEYEENLVSGLLDYEKIADGLMERVQDKIDNFMQECRLIRQNLLHISDSVSVSLALESSAN